jgi:outer membrane receptor for ferric coprogen and ferric-rhodotorulic acid
MTLSSAQRRAVRVPSTALALAFAVSGLLAGAAPAAAQREAGRPGQEPIEQIDVHGKADPNSVLPTKTPVAVFGGERSVLDSPRSVNVISTISLEEGAITGLLDLPRVSSSTYAPNTFGYASLPTIRGQEGELFINGLRRGVGGNGYGLPVNLNPYENLAVVKGPPTVTYGPTQRVGGYVDLVTKRPSLEEWSGEVSARYGQFNHRGWGFDVGGPIDGAGKLGLRLSYEGQNADSFYDHVREDFHDVFAALTWEASPNLTIDWNGEYYHVDFSDNGGWNRPTQRLIDDGLYITGSAGAAPDPANPLRRAITPTGLAKLSRGHAHRPGRSQPRRADQHAADRRLPDQ